MDHYASLGVSRTSEDVVIRAAYLALMRRYHPDGNPSPEAAARVRAITTAYGVLGDEARRREYDRGQGLAPAPPPAARGRGHRTGPLTFAITILCLAVLVWIISARLAPAPGEAGAIALAAEPSPRAAIPEPVTCLSPEARMLSRQAVLRQANGLRQGNRPIVTLPPDAIAVRTAPALSMAGRIGAAAVECAAAVTVLLPRELVTVDGAPTLQGEAEFLLAGNERGEAVLVDLTLDDRFLLALASVRRLASVEDQAPLVAERHEAVPPPATKAVPRRTAASQRPTAVRERPGPSRATATKNARTCDGAACGDGNVRQLERQLAMFERQSLANADSRRRAALRDSRARFEIQRARCGTTACARRAVLDQTVKVAEIMSSRAPASAP